MLNNVTNNLQCRKCGVSSPVGSNYCSYCGAPLVGGLVSPELFRHEDRQAAKIAQKIDNDARIRDSEAGDRFLEWFFRPMPWKPWQTYVVLGGVLWFVFIIFVATNPAAVGLGR